VKKLIFSLLLVLLLAIATIAGASYWFGLQAEKIYTNGLQQLASSHRLTLSSHQYQRGWFSANSAAILTSQHNRTTLKINSVLQHGPFPLRSTIDQLRTDPIALRPVQVIVHSHLQLQAKSTPAYTLSGNAITRVKINADADTTFQIDGGTMQSARGDTIHWSRASGSVHYLQQPQQLAGHIDSHGLELAGPGRTAVLENLKSQFRVNIKNMRSPQYVKVTADTLMMRPAKSAETDLKQFFVELIPVTPAGQTRSLRAGFTTATWQDQQFGPGQVTLSAKALEPLFTNSVKPPELSALLKIFKTHPPRIKATLQVNTGNGSLEGQLDLQLDSQKLARIDPLALFAALKADASLALPRPLLEDMMAEKLRAEMLLLQQQGKISGLTSQQQQQMLDQALPGRINALLSAKTFIELADGRFSSHLQLRNSRLLLNDTPLNIFELLSKFSSKGTDHGRP